MAGIPLDISKSDFFKEYRSNRPIHFSEAYDYAPLLIEPVPDTVCFKEVVDEKPVKFGFFIRLLFPKKYKNYRIKNTPIRYKNISDAELRQKEISRIKISNKHY